MIRNYLKKFALIGLIAEKVERIGKYELTDVVEQKGGVNNLIDLLIRSSKEMGIRDQKLRKLLAKNQFPNGVVIDQTFPSFPFFK